MSQETSVQISYMVLIAGRKQKDQLLSALSETGAQLMNTFYGRGSVKSSYLKSLFGLMPEENKVVITCLLSNDNADAVSKMLIDKFKFDQPNTGIAFTIPVNKLLF